MNELNNKNNNTNKQIMFSLIGIAILIVAVVGVTYAFFNYTRTGAANTVSVGRISFVTRQTKTISLNNLFPIDPTDSEAMSDATKVGTVEIDIVGDTDYVDGVEYLVSSENTNIYTSTGKLVPVSLSVTATNLGTENTNYFTAREDKSATIYKKIVGDTLVGDQMLLVGYIKKNTTNGTIEGVNGKLTIKAYLDKNKILISDTYDGTESDNMGTPNSMAHGKTVLTTTEWNALQATPITFQVKVEANEGIWVKGSLEEIMRSESLGVDTTQGVDFSKTSDQDNTKGVYLRNGTQNDAYPVVYYRGAVENNNVMFANKCWKAVRTTDTGGVKLIYNGEARPVYDKVALSQDKYTIVTNTDGTNAGVWTFDATDSSWNTSYTSGNLELSFKVPAGDGYILEMTGQNGSSGSGGFTIFKGTAEVNGGGGGGNASFALNHLYGTLTADDVVKFTFSGGGFTTPSTFKIKMIAPGDLITSNGCDNVGTDTQITLNGTNTFAFSGTNLNTSPAYNGYMWGTVYEYSTANWTSGAKFGSGFTWDGEKYKLVDATVTTPNATHHYSCNNPDANATCQELRYVYYGTGTKYYITLTDGDGIEEAISKMQTNTNPSNAKNQIDAWYGENLTGYTGKLEDTIWCNDRSMGSGNNNGWIANGGDLSTDLYYGSYQRSGYSTNNATKNQPSLGCVNKNDAFTVSNQKGNQKLQYPAALLTEDEMVLAGGLAGSSSGFYLNTGSYYWSLSPSYFFSVDAYGFNVSSYGGLNYNRVYNAPPSGLRPAVSLKPGTPVISGDGTSTSPYLIR